MDRSIDQWIDLSRPRITVIVWVSLGNRIDDGLFPNAQTRARTFSLSFRSLSRRVGVHDDDGDELRKCVVLHKGG